jgi:PAB1-binding protein PBP1
MDPFFLSGLSAGLGRPNAPAGLVVLNVFAIKGEQGTGFEKAGNLGEFECGNCSYFDATAGACNQEDMKVLSKQPRLADGRVAVAEEDCCEYVQRVGHKDEDENHG